MHWIEKWAAVGDSFTAGIGAGQIWMPTWSDRKCSRYDRSYVALLHHAIGPSPVKFEYVACSGARSGDILEQIEKLDTGHDLVVLTATGNDLCLVDVLKACVFLPYYGEKECDVALDKARYNIQFLVEKNVHEIVKALNKKMKNSGVIVWASYARFFHEGEGNTNDCAFYQDWTFPRAGSVFEPLALTLERRKKFNDLVAQANSAIEGALKKIKDDYIQKIRFANWDHWASDDRIAGQFCWPGSTGQVPDPRQPNLHFFKPDTKRRLSHDETKKKKRDVPALEPEPAMHGFAGGVNGSTVSVNLESEVLRQLQGRAPIDPPGCPGDNDYLSFGVGLPDRWGKFFHPNELGHTTIASFVLHEIISARADILKVRNPICDHKKDFFECKVTRNENLRHYVHVKLVDDTYKTYCKGVSGHERQSGWHDERIFYPGTPEEHKFSISLDTGASQFSYTECVDSFTRIIHGCDGLRDDNPLNLKHGGVYRKGKYSYELSMGPIQRPWPLAREQGSCDGRYKFLFSHYEIRGTGWGTIDSGEKLRERVKSCIGGGLTRWHFSYYDKSNPDGMEWEASFNTPVWVRRRCFANGKVFTESGGPSIGCGGND
ncbi:SGNH hydrolase-type esterase domain-containing protein [Aspergillus avenaceus]|uniref:SGNH hydrolase-type esterase domain-containing protein n=1 Tax=Aspergillus avenaceus TaxID=36643 RepID=A0A5N6U0I9_ASPAV|nr:SGNH hydrolase-type esterase domain-containing protein [Aspergillus avenaceus]